MVKIYPLELYGDNSVLLQKFHDIQQLMFDTVGVGDPNAYELGYFVGMHGGPLSPLETALGAIKGWAEMNGFKNLGEEQIGEWGVYTLMSVFRDIMGGFYAGARSRGAESLIDEAFDQMRTLPKTKRF